MFVCFLIHYHNILLICFLNQKISSVLIRLFNSLLLYFCNIGLNLFSNVFISLCFIYMRFLIESHSKFCWVWYKFRDFFQLISLWNISLFIDNGSLYNIPKTGIKFLDWGTKKSGGWELTFKNLLFYLLLRIKLLKK